MTEAQEDHTDLGVEVQDVQDPEADHQRDKAEDHTADQKAGASLLKGNVNREGMTEEPEVDQKLEALMMTDQTERKENNHPWNKMF